MPKKRRSQARNRSHLSTETVREHLERALCQEIDANHRLLELKVLRQYEEDLGRREELGQKLARQQIKVLRLRRASAAFEQQLDAKGSGDRHRILRIVASAGYQFA